jgi:hypothetical protein
MLQGNWHIQPQAALQPLKAAQLTVHKLEISIETVKSHKKQLTSKLGISPNPSCSHRPRMPDRPDEPEPKETA